MARKVDVASKLCRNKFFRDLMPGGKHSPYREEPGGGGLGAMPRLQRLGIQVVALGRYTADDQPVRDFMQSEGIQWRMHQVDGPGIVNAIIERDGEPSVLRVLPGPADWTPTREEGEYLSHSGADATVLCGSLPPDYAEFLITTSAAKGQPAFWNPGAGADLGLASLGQVFLQAAYAEFGDGKQPPNELTLELLASSGAAACVVTDAERGCYGILRGDKQPMYAPAVRLPENIVQRTLGAGDAFFAGFICGLLLVKGPTRLERALHLGRMVAAYHVSGAAGGSWYQLGLFEKQFYSQEHPVRPAA